MLVSNVEDMASSKTGCYPTLSSLYSIIPRDVRLHMERVGIYAEIFYRYLVRFYGYLIAELEPDFAKYARELFTLHDIGRAFVPIRFQNKAGELTVEEFAQIKLHTMLSMDAMDSIYWNQMPPWMAKRLANIALYHHEKWDGSGYPFGRSGEEIPLEARICSLADAYDGMTSWKPYRKSMTAEKVKEIVGKEAGGQFEPQLAAAFRECIDLFPINLDARWEAGAGKYFIS